MWCYSLARHARSRALRDRKRDQRGVQCDVRSIQIAADNVRTRTAEYLRTETRERIDRLRAELEPDDQMLLVLRITRQFEWKEIARSLADVDEALDDAELSRRAAALRKRYQRVKDQLRAAMRGDAAAIVE